MSSDAALGNGAVVSLRGVGKKYKLFDKPLERVLEALHPMGRVYHKPFWALNDIHLDIAPGETVGFLGPNGSGKSTLLQIISGVLQPSTGSVSVSGRISALLELGAGFNPEFSGRENVVLSGTIQGLSPGEIAQRMSEIVAFADIGAHFDQPVKTYSSGMYVRVAFAVAIMTHPDILIVDEALAVGDARFQHKCFAKFEEFKKMGKTILFVSHSLDLISRLCDRAVLLEGGSIRHTGGPKEVVDLYVKSLFTAGDWNGAEAVDPALPVPAAAVDASGGKVPSLDLDDFIHGGHVTSLTSRPCYNAQEIRLGDGRAAILDALLVVDGRVLDHPALTPSHNSHQLLFKVRFVLEVKKPIYGFCIKTKDGIVIYATNTFMDHLAPGPAAAGEVRVVAFHFEARLLPGDYFLDLGVAEMDGSPGGIPLDVRRSCIHFYVHAREKFQRDGLIDLHTRFEVLT